MRATISRAEVFALCRSLGADPDDVRDITVTPSEVTVTTYLRNAEGQKYFDEAADDAAMHRHVIPIVGDTRRDTVAMRHPDLPGRVIDVRPRGVGQRAMAGWEVVAPAAEPPPKDPPPESGSKPEAPAEPGASSSPPPRGRRQPKKKEDG